jgi:hypothetical protein
VVHTIHFCLLLEVLQLIFGFGCCLSNLFLIKFLIKFSSNNFYSCEWACLTHYFIEGAVTKQWQSVLSSKETLPWHSEFLDFCELSELYISRLLPFFPTKFPRVDCGKWSCLHFLHPDISVEDGTRSWEGSGHLLCEHVSSSSSCFLCTYWKPDSMMGPQWTLWGCSDSYFIESDDFALSTLPYVLFLTVL